MLMFPIQSRQVACAYRVHWTPHSVYNRHCVVWVFCSRSLWHLIITICNSLFVFVVIYSWQSNKNLVAPQQPQWFYQWNRTMTINQCDLDRFNKINGSAFTFFLHRLRFVCILFCIFCGKSWELWWLNHIRMIIRYSCQCQGNRK